MSVAGWLIVGLVGTSPGRLLTTFEAVGALPPRAGQNNTNGQAFTLVDHQRHRFQ